MTYSRTQSRKALRLRSHDYSSFGAYYVTICSQQRECLFGDVTDGHMHLNTAGELVMAAWYELPGRFTGVVLDAAVLMPNHFHGVLLLACDDPVIRPSVPRIIRAFKSISAIAVNRALGRAGVPVWQERYHDRVVRDQDELERIRAYIEANPANWSQDAENPDRDPSRRR